MINIIAILLAVCAISFEIWNIFHKKYEVLGIVIDPIKGGMTAKSQKFRRMSDAQKCYADCKNQFTTVCIIEH